MKDSLNLNLVLGQYTKKILRNAGSEHGRHGWFAEFNLKFWGSMEKDFYSLMSYCNGIIGNSSSGIIESMIYKKPAINILPRQLGRHSNGNVINCNNNLNDICKSIDKAISNDFKKKCNKLKNFFKKNNIKPSKIMLKQILKRYA